MFKDTHFLSVPKSSGSDTTVMMILDDQSKQETDLA
jgi:hypothetical protein